MTTSIKDPITRIAQARHNELTIVELRSNPTRDAGLQLLPFTRWLLLLELRSAENSVQRRPGGFPAYGRRSKVVFCLVCQGNDPLLLLCHGDGACRRGTARNGIGRLLCANDPVRRQAGKNALTAFSSERTVQPPQFRRECGGAVKLCSGSRSREQAQRRQPQKESNERTTMQTTTRGTQRILGSGPPPPTRSLVGSIRNCKSKASLRTRRSK